MSCANDNHPTVTVLAVAAIGLGIVAAVAGATFSVAVWLLTHV